MKFKNYSARHKRRLFASNTQKDMEVILVVEYTKCLVKDCSLLSNEFPERILKKKKLLIATMRKIN